MTEKRTLLAALLREKLDRVKRLSRVSAGQAALWYLQQLAPSASAYNVVVAARVCSALDPLALERALRRVVARHESLRTTFLFAGEPIAKAHDRLDPHFQIVEARGWSDERLDREARAVSKEPFQLDRGPLLRVHLFRRSPDDILFVLTVHHIVSDLWSILIVMDELGQYYLAELDGTAWDLAEPAARYRDHVRSEGAFLRSGQSEDAWRHWKSELGGNLPLLELPLDRPRPPVQSFSGGSVLGTLSAELSANIREFAKREGATFFATLLAAYQILLHRYSTQSELIVGVPTSGRAGPRVRDVVGYFVNPVAIRSDVEERPTFRTHVRAQRAKLLAAIAHSELPFSTLVEGLHPRRDPSRSPIFQATFAVEQPSRMKGLASLFMLGRTQTRVTWAGLTLEPYYLSQQEGQFDLKLEIADVAGEVPYAFQYDGALFEERSISRLADSFEALLEAAMRSPDAPVLELPLLRAPERAAALERSTGEAREVPETRLHEIIEKIAARSPDTPAVTFGELVLTYRELVDRARGVARALAERSLPLGAPVALYFPRGPELIVAALGVMMAGGAYLPLDPASPRERIEYMIAAAGAPVVVMLRAHEGALDAPRIYFDELDAAPAAERPSGERAYVIYTSGSTGAPKGVACTHRGVINLIDEFQRRWPITAGRRVSTWSAFYWDASVYEIFSGLLIGAGVDIAPEEARYDGTRFAEWLHHRRIAGAYVPAFMLPDIVAWAQKNPGGLSLERMMVGAEPIPRRTLHALSRALPWTKIVNAYGPTEAAICSTLKYVDEDLGEDGITPIGRPVQNTRVYLLDGSFQPVPTGVAGEMVIAGAGVAEGYLGEAELNAQKFVADPFGSGRAYRTGDLARRRPDGEIEFLGRVDRQVKVRGLRIELPEIEIALAKNPQIKEVAVVAREDQPGDKRIVAYCVARDDGKVQAEDLREWLKKLLPEYMIPSAFVPLGVLPKTASGKLDARALPTPPSDRGATRNYVAPRSEVEAAIAAIWQEVLKIDRAGTSDNFFDLGGHSLLLPQIQSRIRSKLGVEVSLVDLLTNQTIQRQAAFLRADTRSEAAPQAGRSRAEIRKAAMGRKPR